MGAQRARRDRGAPELSRTVLVTGGAGFVGANLTRLLASGGDHVRILDDLSAGTGRYLDRVPCELVVAPLADDAAVAAAVAGVDAVVHLAARAGIDDSVADPRGTQEVNVSQAVGLLDAARLAGVERFVFASSNAAAGNHPPPADESNLPHPISPYGASKLAGEAYVQAFAATYGLAACALRFSNAYGPWSLHKRSVVAAWLRAALAGRPIRIDGGGHQTRDFIFVEDIAAAIAAALDAPTDATAGEVFQVGTGIETAVNDLAVAIGRVVGRAIEIEHGPARSGDVTRNVSRVDKAAERLGFRAATSLDTGLAATAAWLSGALVDPGLASIAPDASGSDLLS
jgi:UDP-glucose 4-epimerase